MARRTGGGHASYRSTAALGLLLALAVVGQGCTPAGSSRAGYLEQGIGRLTRTQVERQFGPPLMQIPGEHGETIYIYRYAGMRAQTPAAVEELWCYEEALIFGPDRVLQRWQRRDCEPSGDSAVSRPGLHEP